MQKTIILLLVFVFVFSDIAPYLHIPFPLHTEIEKAHAATGDFATFTEGSGIEDIDSTGVVHDVTWDSSPDTSANITLQGNTSDIDLAEGGKYLVTYNTWAYEGTSGANRRSVNSFLTLDGTPLAYGRGAGYVRDSETTDVAYARGSAIIDAMPGDDLQVHLQRDDTNTGVSTETSPGTNGVSVIKFPDNADYVRARLVATSSNISGNTTFTDVSWDTADEVDTDSFTFTPSSADITLKGDVGDYFLVNANIGLFVSGGGTARQNYEMRLTLDDGSKVEVPGTVVTTYMRGTNGTWYGQLVYTGLIAKTSSSDQDLNVQVRRESSTSANTVIMGDKSALSIVAVPSTAEIVRLTDNSGSQIITNAAQPLTFDTQEEIAGSAFSHSTTTNADRVQIDAAGDYLFFATAYSTTTNSSNNNREPFRVTWNVTGAGQEYGGFGGFNRSNGSATAGSSGAILLSDLGTSDYVAMSFFDESSNAPDSVPTFSNGRVAVQGIALNENFYGLDTFVSASGTHITSSDIPATDVYVGGQFVIQEESSARNISNITITEQGTVDASTGLDNIELWYELSTVAPYDCSEDSFDGGETQFGSTDTNGFTAANGTSNFNGTIPISPTQSACVYVVLDVTSSASDSETIEISIVDAVGGDVQTSPSGSMGTDEPHAISGSVTLANAALTQIHYHWREDNDTSASAGVEDTVVGGFQDSTIRRLRIEVSAEGAADADPVQFRLQYAEKITTCEDVSTWTNTADTGGAWEVLTSANVTHEADTVDIAEGIGGVTNEEFTFLTSNAAQINGSDKTSDITILSDEFVELEYTVSPTATAVNGATYCFRVVDESLDVTHSSRIPVVIQSSEVDTTLTDFPIYVDLSDMPAHFFSSVQADGGDIRVTASDGITELAREVVSIDTGGTDGELYFSADTISSSANTTFYIYYGNTTMEDYQANSVYGAEGVWSNGYESVYHFEEDPSDGAPQYIDSTGNSQGTSINMEVADQVSGVLGNAADIDGVDEHIETDLNAGSLTNSTWSLFLNTDGTQGACDGTMFSRGTSISGMNVGACGDTSLIGYHWNDAAATYNWVGGPTYPTDEWFMASMVVEPTQSTVYAHTDAGVTSGVNVAAHAASIVDDFDLGWDSNGVVRSFDGTMDEMRLSSVARSQSWLDAVYINIATSTDFYSVSSQESLAANASVITYSVYPEANVDSDVFVSASGVHAGTVVLPSTDNYLGGTFAIAETTGSRDVTSITVTESGTVDGSQGIENIRLFYDLDTTAGDGYDCTDQSFSGVGSETSFAAADTDGFSSANGTSTFINAGVTISTTGTMCVYVVYDLTSSSTNGETVDINITSPNIDIVLDSGSVGPGSAVGPTGSTTVTGPIRTQTHYHWRSDNGSELTASSSSDGGEDTEIINVPQGSIRRIRIQVSNEGLVSSASTNYRLEYGTQVTSCSEVGTWTDVGALGGAWDMTPSTFISDGNTTDIDDANFGAMTEENTTFVGTGALRENTSESGNITLTATEYTELEYSIASTANAGYDTTYCFRVSDSGADLEEYLMYPVLTTREKQDFFIQRGSEQISGTSLTLVAGVHYDAPSATSAAFVRITNSHHTGAGNETGSNGQNADEVTAYISDQSDLTTGFTIGRPSAATSNTRVSWEIVEFIGLPGTDNEMIVRGVGELSVVATEFTQTGPVFANIMDDADVVVYVTGQQNNSGGRSDYNDGIFTSEWNSTTSQPVIERGDADASADVSYAVVEFTGANWQVQRIVHTYTAAGTPETEDLVAIPSATQAFIHAQKRTGEAINNIDELGHRVWLSGMGLISFELEPGVISMSENVSVAWVIANTQTGTGAMKTYQSSGSIASGASEPALNIISIGGTVRPANSSIFATNYAFGTGTTFPRVQAGFTLIDETTYELWQSDTANNLTYRVEVVEWPVAETSIRQNYYRFYVDNDSLTPDDPWPLDAAPLGENTSITSADDPLGEGERVRIRMSLLINNATLPESVIAFKLQYGFRDSSCSAIDSWNDIGASGDGTIWRGHDATIADGTSVATSTPAPGTLLLSLSDVAGSYEEANNTAINPFAVDLGQEVEYDWHIEHNGASQRSDYCFRMVESDGTELDGYNNYPTLRTTGYSPISNNWRWYDDETNETPTTPLATENSAPIGLEGGNIVKLRLAATEVESAPGVNVKFSLQYSEHPDFIDGGTFLTSVDSCVASSTWCFADGVDTNDDVIQSALLSSGDSCVAGVGDGCGLHNEASTTASTLGQPSLSTQEHEFTLEHRAARAGAVYYFRLYDVPAAEALVASSTYPSISTETAQLVFGMAGLAGSTNTEGIDTDLATTPEAISFGTLGFDTVYEAAHRLSVDTDATQGYQMLVVADQSLVNSYGDPIPDVTGTNAVPLAWGTGCDAASMIGCFGYHAGDDLLQGGDVRFGADDSYAAFSTTPQEIMYSSIPTTESHDIVYKIMVGEEQPAGDYQTTITYIAVPVF